MKPIDIMMRDVDWQEIKVENPPQKELYATHEGILKIGDIELRCNVLNNGRTFILVEYFERFFSAMSQEV